MCGIATVNVANVRLRWKQPDGDVSTDRAVHGLRGLVEGRREASSSSAFSMRMTLNWTVGEERTTALALRRRGVRRKGARGSSYLTKWFGAPTAP
ncbi:MAG: hypothetical protein BGO98_18500 [Myxococcales bacterium 68-20]|nr:MAG: hypothetical protein BGO98_18500 [Myxococcales bacterium 68-20]